MRAYFFGNFYLSSIQQGIQAQHCTAELFIKFRNSYEAKHADFLRRQMLIDWAQNHKTSVLLNGGDCDGLSDVRTIMMCDENPYPWAYFKESIGALSEALTCVGIILPEKVYECFDQFRKPERYRDHALLNQLTEWEYTLGEAASKCGLAR